MKLTKMTCQGFRGLSDLEFFPGPGINLLYGANAQGKTSVLEAILYASTARSHRSSNDSELVRHGTEEFHIYLEAETAKRPLFIEAHWWKKAKRFKVNDIAQSRLSDLLGHLCIVFFSPDDISLVKGGAGVRRLFMDMELSQLNTPYLRALQQYRQALRQRNEMLKQIQCDEELLELWEAQLVAQGSILMAERSAYVEELSAIASPLYSRIVEAEELAITYCPDIPEAEEFASVLERSRKADQQRRTTSRGPHRDDMEILISGRSARIFGSQGQQKSAALIVKLAEVALVRSRINDYPLILLDEATAELDAERTGRLFEALPEEAQVLITTAQPAQLPDSVRDESQIFHLEEGSLEKITT